MPVRDIKISAKFPLNQKRILSTWWPLAASWLLITVEGPLLAAFIARTANPEINLAAWGIAFPIVLLLGSPALALLPTSTSFSKDVHSFRKLLNFSLVLVATLTSLHAAIAFTPLYGILVKGLLGIPDELFEPARTGLRILLPFIAAVGVRRLIHGVLIRFGFSRSVTISSGIRLGIEAVVLVIFFQFFPDVEGIILASATFTAGVFGEAIYAVLRVKPIFRNQLSNAPPPENPLTIAPILNFFTPLVLTILIGVTVQPMVAAALSRMPNPVSSLAIWPIIIGMLTVFTSAAHAYVEVVVVLLDEPRSLRVFHRFTMKLGLALIVFLFLFNVTPISLYWFRDVLALPEDLVVEARQSLWIMSLMPGLAVFDSLSSGTLMNGRRTRGITLAILLSLICAFLLIIGGIAIGSWSGITVCLLALAIGGFLRSGMLWYAGRSVRQEILRRDANVTQN